MTGVLCTGGVWGASPSGVRGGAPRRNFCVFEAKNRQFRLPKCPQTSLPFMSTRKSSPRERSQKEPRSAIGLSRPELVLLLLLSAQPGPPGSCRGCTRASTHTCRMNQLHNAPEPARTTLHHVVAMRLASLHRVFCAVAQPCAAQRRLTLTGVNDFRHVHTCFPCSF